MLLELLAFLAALTVDAVQTKQGRDDRHDHADRLGAELAFDMRDWWTPSIDGFYQRLPKTVLIEVVTAAQPSAAAGNLAHRKKADMAALAAKTLAGSGWLPEPLRSRA